VPIFEFVCSQCANEYEELVFQRDVLVPCPKCGSAKVKKKLSVFAHKSDSGFTPSAGKASGCSGCSSSSCAGCK
jgi:putative FmdB family regulatory protein